jgi:hypothetical protein
VTLYRAVYELKMVDISSFSSENCGELVTLLERLDEKGAEATLQNAGLFLNHDDRVDLMSRLVRGIRVAWTATPSQPDAFRAMLRDEHSFDRAVSHYISVFVDPDGVIEKCAAEFASDTGRPVTVQSGAEAELRRLLQRKIVVIQELLPALLDLLRTIAVHEGVLPRGSSAAAEASDDERAFHDEGDELADALKLFDLSPPFRRRELQKRYRKLMRAYHPDVNPRGLEMAKRINRAYSALVSQESD